MLGRFRRWLQRDRDRSELLRLRVFAGAVHDVLFPDGQADVALMVRTGSRIRGAIERETSATLDVEDDLIDDRSWTETAPIPTLELLAKRFRERGAQAGEEHSDLAPALSLNLIGAWICARAIARRNEGTELGHEADELANIYFGHLRNLIRFMQGKPTVPFEGRTKRDGIRSVL